MNPEYGFIRVQGDPTFASFLEHLLKMFHVRVSFLRKRSEIILINLNYFTHEISK
jgi:hypothetical protein